MSTNPSLDVWRIKDQSWSFSKIKTYVNCPKEFDLLYIQKKLKKDNAFSQWGIFLHLILEKYYKNEIELYDLLRFYQSNYQEYITLNFPSNLDDRYYFDGIEYLENFEGIPENYDVLEVEKKFNYYVNDIKVSGVIDLILRNKLTGTISIMDHKSRSAFKSKKDIDNALEQLYIYSRFINQEYRQFPEFLNFNLIRGNQIIQTPFDKTQYIEVMKRFLATVEKIKTDDNIKDKIYISYKAKGKLLSKFKKNDFYCNFLCGARNYCNRSKDFRKGGGEYRI